MNQTCFERIYADNRLKRFETKDVEDSSTKQTEIYKILNVTFENSINAMKKSNIVNKNVQISDEVRNEVVRNTAGSLNAYDQIFEDIIIDNNLLNSKIRNIHAIIKFSIRRSNRLIEIEILLSSIERKTNTIAFATIDEISIEKE